MNKEQKRLWRFGIRLLKRIHRDQSETWNLGDWAAGEDSCVYNPNYCGTTACAMGHFALNERFQRAGLKLICNRPDRSVVTSFDQIKNVKGNVSFHVDYCGEHGEDAAAELFGISYEEAFICFIPNSDYGKKSEQITALDVAEMMETVLEKHLNDPD